MAALELTLNPAEAPRIRVVRSLRQWIGQGLIGRGETLPSARALSTKLSVDRRTIGHALDELKREGLLRSAAKGGRALVVSGEMTKEASAVLRNAVVVLNGSEGAPGGHRRTGWAEYIARGALQAIGDAGLHAMSLHPFHATPEEIGNILVGRPYGIIVPEISKAFRDVQKYLESFAPSIPMVVYGDWPESQAYDRVVSDHEAGSYELTRWLLSQGRRRIVTVWSDKSEGYWLARRRAGYERAMREAGLDPLPPCGMPPFPEQGYSSPDDFADLGRHVAGYLLEALNTPTPADALMLSTDGHFFATAAACRRLGKEPGREVLITGYDNYWQDSPERAALPEPYIAPAATVDKQNMLIGRELVALLRRRVAGELPEKPQVRFIEPKIVDCTA